MSNDTYYDRIAEKYRAADASAAWIYCDQHRPESTAYSIVGDDSVATVTYADLRRDSVRLANAMRNIGIGEGSRVASLLGKGPELITTMIATWRLGAVYVPLFTAFATPAIDFRLRTANVQLVITDRTQRSKVPVAEGADGNWRIVCVDGSGEPGDVSYADLVASGSDDEFRAHAQGPDGALVHIFTSGTTGVPKGVIHPLRHAAGWQSYLEYGLGVTHDDVYWCAADPGWAYGLYAAVVSPLAAGLGTILQQGSFDPARAWSVIHRLGVTNFTAAPTVYRAIRNAFPTVPAATKLRRLSSCGEPLTPEVNEWAERELGLLVHDHYGQTEVGMILANSHYPELAQPIVVGSMGRELPGWSAKIIAEDSDQQLPPGEIGRVAIDIPESPAMTFTNYQDPTKSASRFAGDGRYYVLGDLGSRDASGAFKFSTRDDDVIIMAGYRIGPFEVESAMSKHPSVAESAAIAAPDADRGEVLEAFIVLVEGIAGSEELVVEIQTFVKENYAAHAYPRAIHFVTELPKTPSGKIQRAVLRQQRRDELTNGHKE
jgi:acetyl-CoA synthetase